MRFDHKDKDDGSRLAGRGVGGMRLGLRETHVMQADCDCDKQQTTATATTRVPK